MNKWGISRYNFIQKNTIGYWLAISIAMYISKIKYFNYKYTPIFYILIIFIHELLWYSLPFFNRSLYFLKDEAEVTSNWYSWGNIYCGPIKNVSNGVDWSEGLFNNNWNLSDSESYKLKYQTYYDYLKLKPGMELLDIGCGNCQWLYFCKNKGIKCTGITISKSNREVCNNNGITNIILGDIQKNILLKINKKFDAISAIGPVEHFSSISEPLSHRIDILNKYYSQVKNLIKSNSSSKRYLNSIMTTNINYSKYQSLEWFFNIYFVASAFGYGYYPTEKEMNKIYNSKNSKIIIKKDYTEDYRWIMIRNNDSIGYCKYRINSINRIYHLLKDILIDPSWWQRLCYGHFDCWLWQFGGSSNKPIPHVKDTPIRGYVYVTEINKLV